MQTGADNPILSGAEDRLGRVGPAKKFANQLHRVDVRQGSVVAVLGRWGSGKTSFINIVRGQLSANDWSLIMDFNPWMFSGSDQLVHAFFAELAAQFGAAKNDRLVKAGGLLETYGGLLAPAGELPIIGAFVKAG